MKKTYRIVLFRLFGPEEDIAKVRASSPEEALVSFGLVPDEANIGDESAFVPGSMVTFPLYAAIENDRG